MLSSETTSEVTSEAEYNPSLWQFEELVQMGVLQN